MGRLKTLDEWLNYQEKLHNKTIDLGLERIEKVYKKLFPNGVPFTVITIAGTNGKGSTIAFVDSIYQQSKFKVGKFTSPHITNYNERFTINGKQANDSKICTAFEKIESIRGGISLTYFEFSTLAALLIFTQNNVDVAILEVGLGGRLDSVNVVYNNISVITNIDIDHTDYLGNTRELIGAEKAGIMRKNIVCICADSNPPKSITTHANNVGAILEFVTDPYTKDIGLKGEHQQYNAATAIEVVKKLSKILPVDSKQIANGVKSAKLNGRFQVQNINNKTVILDVAHNEAAVGVLATELAKSKQPTIAIFSVLEDKSIKLMIKKISPVIDKWLLVQLDDDRAINVNTLSEKFDLKDNISIANNINSAIFTSLNSKQYQRIVVFGSFHTVAGATKALNTVV